MALLRDIFESFITGGQPWWVYAVAALVPICMLIAVREFACWFWKINKLVNRIERVENALKSLDGGAADPGRVQSFSRRTGEAKKGPSEP